MKHQEFINTVKETIRDQPMPPKYNPKEWKKKEFNCYAYALLACMDFTSCELSVRPGFISGGADSDYIYSKENILKYFKEDCEVLGLQIVPSNLKEKTARNEYKIAVYGGCGFHFARQDANGRWSEKNGWWENIKILPKKDVTKNRKGYQFIGIFKVTQKVG